MSVKLDIPPERGQLDCWGLGPGGWWALIVWTEQVMPPGANNGVHWLHCAACTHATHVRPASDPRDYDPPPRITLPSDRTAWPAPHHRPHAVWPEDGWFAGVLDGGIPQLPPAFERAGAGWSAYG
jgi:hypothetical protein